MRALFRRVRLAAAEAERSVARSRALVAMRRLIRHGALVRRCAWCGRYSLSEEWMQRDELPGFVTARVLEDATHTICPDCERGLVAKSQSRPTRPEADPNV